MQEPATYGKEVINVKKVSEIQDVPDTHLEALKDILRKHRGMALTVPELSKESGLPQPVVNSSLYQIRKKNSWLHRKQLGRYMLYWYEDENERVVESNESNTSETNE